jgi:hypothetical protein
VLLITWNRKGVGPVPPYLLLPLLIFQPMLYITYIQRRLPFHVAPSNLMFHWISQPASNKNHINLTPGFPYGVHAKIVVFHLLLQRFTVYIYTTTTEISMYTWFLESKVLKGSWEHHSIGWFSSLSFSVTGPLPLSALPLTPLYLAYESDRCGLCGVDNTCECDEKHLVQIL